MPQSILVFLLRERKEGNQMLSLDKIYHAAFILKSVARKTDLIAAPHLSEGNN